MKKIGGKIRKLRKEKNMTIKELAEDTELSPAMISQLERNKKGISVTSLWKIAQALEMPINYFFQEEKKKEEIIIKHNERPTIQAGDSDTIFELLTPDLSKKIEFLRMVIQPGESNDNKMVSHKGEESGVIIQGRLLIKYGEKEFILEEGDSIYIDSTIPHQYINIGEVPSISFWAMTPKSLWERRIR